jgi:c(7)-type cytochrome triheme protein
MKSRLVVVSLALLLTMQGAAFAVTVRDVVFSTGNAGRVVFSHGDHINRKGLSKNCNACHDALFDLKKKKHYSMADMNNGRSCGACHDGKRSFPLKECTRCHQIKEITYRVKVTGPTGFSHAKHLQTSADCRICHPSLFAAGPNKRFSMADMKKGKSCGACHNSKKAFGLDACVNCHPVKEITFRIKETGPTHFSHKRHLSVAECGACHPGLYAADRKNRPVGMAAMEKGKSCGACHDSKQAFSVKECTKCHPTGELLFEDKSAGNVVFSHKNHTGLYRCGDCHTELYQTARSTSRVSMQEMEKGKSCGKCHEGSIAFGVKDTCESCHKI